MKRPTLEQGKNVRRKQNSKEELLWTDHKPPILHPPALLAVSRGARSEGVSEQLGGEFDP